MYISSIINKYGDTDKVKADVMTPFTRDELIQFELAMMARKSAAIARHKANWRES